MTRGIINVWAFLQELATAGKKLLPADVLLRIAAIGMDHEAMLNEIGFSQYLPADFDCGDVPGDYGLVWEVCPHPGNDDHLSIYVNHSGLFLSVSLGRGGKLINVELVPENGRLDLTFRLETERRGKWTSMNKGALTDDIVYNANIPCLRGTVWNDGRAVFFQDALYESLWLLTS